LGTAIQKGQNTMSTTEPDTIDVAAKIACDAHGRGELGKADLVKILEELIDARAVENGYAERYGLPSQQGKMPGRISLAALKARRVQMRLCEDDGRLVDAAIEIAEAALEYRDVAPVDEGAAITRLWRALEYVEP
jgi:hypothetical protein